MLCCRGWCPPPPLCALARALSSAVVARTTLVQHVRDETEEFANAAIFIVRCLLPGCPRESATRTCPPASGVCPVCSEHAPSSPPPPALTHSLPASAVPAPPPPALAIWRRRPRFCQQRHVRGRLTRAVPRRGRRRGAVRRGAAVSHVRPAPVWVGVCQSFPSSSPPPPRRRMPVQCHGRWALLALPPSTPPSPFYPTPSTCCVPYWTAGRTSCRRG